jgi:hypothetical protein
VTYAAAAILLLAGAAALALPPPAAPDFAASQRVLEAIDALLRELKPRSEGEGRSWQAIRARAACEVARGEIEHTARARSYTPGDAERRWAECVEAWGRVP